MQDEIKIRVWVYFWEEMKRDFFSSSKGEFGGQDLHLLLEMVMLELGSIFSFFSSFLYLPPLPFSL
jgi:hypothetical protein